MGRFSRIHHVAIIVSNYNRSKHFYSEVLGFEVVREVYREERRSYKLDLKVDERTTLELFSFSDPPLRLSYPEACGLRHLAFSVGDIEASIAYLNARGIEVEDVRVDEFTGQKFTFFQDPDGLPIELYEDR